ncbi:MAG: lysylphosphatidylglycerol synthase transmembrane domain-containing protein [Patescibacteria group bacterium]|jgi:hypothetical protein
MNLDKNFFSWPRIIIILLFGIAIWILIPKLIGLTQALQLLRQIKYWALILALVAEGFYYVGSAILTRAVLRMTGDKLKFIDVIKISLLDSFSIQFLPLGTFGEGAVDYYFLKEKKIRTAHIVLMFIARVIIVYLIFAFIYLIGVAFSPTNHGLSARALIVIWITYLAAFGFFFYLLSLYSRKPVLIQRVAKLARLANRILKIVKVGRIPLNTIPELVQKFYEAVKILAKNRHLQINAVTGAILFWGGDIMCLFFALWGFGYTPHLPMVIFAYSAARILSLVSFIPGGLGIVEGTLALIFIGFGVPAGIALAAVLIFRLISFWLPIPVGLVSFLSLRKKYIQARFENVLS